MYGRAYTGITMKKWIAATLILCGCAAARSLPDDMNAGLTKFDGKPIQAAIDVLGCPDSQRVIAGDTVNRWMIGHKRDTDIPTTSTVTCTTREVLGSPNVPVGY
jgi:hypothetical protein